MKTKTQNQAACTNSVRLAAADCIGLLTELREIVGAMRADAANATWGVNGDLMHLRSVLLNEVVKYEPGYAEMDEDEAQAAVLARVQK